MTLKAMLSSPRASLGCSDIKHAGYRHELAGDLKEFKHGDQRECCVWTRFMRDHLPIVRRADRTAVSSMESILKTASHRSAVSFIRGDRVTALRSRLSITLSTI